MKILLLTQFFSSTKGGGEYVFNLIAKKLVEHNHQVWIITNKILGEKYEKINGMNLVFIPPTLEYKGGIPPGFIDNIRYIYNALKISLKIIKENNITIIHSNNFAPVMAGSILSSLTSCPHITTIHDVFSLCGKDYWKKWGKQNKVSKLNVILAPYFEKLMIKLKMNAIHTVSNASKDDLIKFGANKPILVIPNSIEPKEPIKSQVNPLHFIFIGRLVFYKNLEIAIRAINLVSKKFSNVKLTIVGDGPYKKNLELLINNLKLQKNIEFVGYASEEEKLKLLASSSALLFPSLCEGFGLVVLEAFSQNKPVLVSNIQPLSDIVKTNKNGFVLSSNNENEWADAIIKLIENPSESVRMGEIGHHILNEDYNEKVMISKIIEMYEKFQK